MLFEPGVESGFFGVVGVFDEVGAAADVHEDGATTSRALRDGLGMGDGLGFEVEVLEHFGDQRLSVPGVTVARGEALEFFIVALRGVNVLAGKAVFVKKAVHV